MDRILNPRIETQTIYEIYRACRLCGAGAGYKMPIIQNVVDLDGSEVELKQKIRECVQIEVHQDDKMPPLICELCVDKVNDFYEFLDLCRQTNKRTRQRLGLPMQPVRKESETGNCILGVTETVYIDDSDGEPLSKHKENEEKSLKNKNKDREKLSKLRSKIVEPLSKLKNKPKDVKTVKKESDVRVKIENQTYNQRSSCMTSSRSSRSNKRSHSPRRSHRNSKSSDDMTHASSCETKKSSSKITPKSILKKEKDISIKSEESPHTPRLRSTKEEKDDDMSLLKPRPKRFQEKDFKEEVPAKKVKLSVYIKQSPKVSPKSSPKGAKPPAKPPAKAPAKGAPSSARAFFCGICKIYNKNSQGNASHMRGHLVTYTNIKLACNACGEWFSNYEEAYSHHKKHKTKGIPYTCRRCTANFQQQQAYTDHFDKKQCIPWEEVPDVKCENCWRQFPTKHLMEGHRCLGEDGRPGGKCSKCKRVYALLKNLTKHEVTCTAKKKGDLIVDPDVLERLKPMQIRVARCDPLLTNIKQEHYDVSTVNTDYGLDRSCHYPYIASVSSIRIKTEPVIEEYDSMVAIKEEIKEEFCTEEDYVHWDSEESTDEDVTSNLVINPFAKKKKLETLSTLSLKTIFSQKFLGKVPRKKRKVKTEKNAFDSTLNTSEFNADIRKDIDNVICNLGNNGFNETDDLHNSNNSMFDSLIQDDTVKNHISAVDAYNKDNPNNLLGQDSSENNKISNNGAMDILQWNEMDEKMIDDNFDGSSSDSMHGNEQNKNFNNENYNTNDFAHNTNTVKEVLANARNSIETNAVVSKNNDHNLLQDDINVQLQTDSQENAESKSVEEKSVLNNKINDDIDIFVEGSTKNNSLKEDLTANNRMEAESLKNNLLESMEQESTFNDKIEENQGSSSIENVPMVNIVIKEANPENNLLEIKSTEVEGMVINGTVGNNSENSLLYIKSAEEGPMVNNGIEGENLDISLLEIKSTKEGPTVKNIMETDNLENSLIEMKSIEKELTNSNVIEEENLDNNEIEKDYLETSKLQKDVVENKNTYSMHVDSAMKLDEDIEKKLLDDNTEESKNKSIEVEINHKIDGLINNCIEKESSIDETNEMELEARLLDDISSDDTKMSMEVELNNKIDEEALENHLLNESKTISNDSFVDFMNNEQIFPFNDIAMMQHKDKESDKTDEVMVHESVKEDSINIPSQSNEVTDPKLQSAGNDSEALNSHNKQDVINDAINDIIIGSNDTICDVNNDINQVNDYAAAEDIQCITKKSDFKDSSDSEFMKNFNNDSFINSVSKNNDRVSLDEVSDTEMEDRKLMEALDAQIGEGNDCGQNNDSAAQNNVGDFEKDKITLADLLSKRDDDLRSMDLDSISDDDFNFDI